MRYVPWILFVIAVGVAGYLFFKAYPDEWKALERLMSAKGIGEPANPLPAAQKGDEPASRPPTAQKETPRKLSASQRQMAADEIRRAHPVPDYYGVFLGNDQIGWYDITNRDHLHMLSAILSGSFPREYEVLRGPDLFGEYAYINRVEVLTHGRNVEVSYYAFKYVKEIRTITWDDETKKVDTAPLGQWHAVFCPKVASARVRTQTRPIEGRPGMLRINPRREEFGVGIYGIVLGSPSCNGSSWLPVANNSQALQRDRPIDLLYGPTPGGNTPNGDEYRRDCVVMTVGSEVYRTIPQQFYESGRFGTDDYRSSACDG